jgi:hypothetical protein
VTPTVATPPTPIRADVEVAPAVAPVAKGLLAEEEATTVTYCTFYIYINRKLFC